MVTLADLRARSTVPSWQQAVAIVQELFLATVRETGSAVRLPGIGHIGLNPDGTIALLPHSSIPENPVRYLAVLLCLMLDKVPSPAPLLDLAERNLKDPPEFPQPDEFTRALRYFERPGRGEDIKELVTRAERAREQNSAEDEFRRLEERARELLEAKEIPERHVLERDGTVTVIKLEDHARLPRLPAVNTVEILGPEEVPAVRSKWDVHGTVRLLITAATLAYAMYWIAGRSSPGGPTGVEERVAKAARSVFGDETSGEQSRAAGGGSTSAADRAPGSAPVASPGPTTGSSQSAAAPAGSGVNGPASTPAPAAATSGPAVASAGSGGGSAPPPGAGLAPVDGSAISDRQRQDGAGQASDRTFSSSDADVTPPVLLAREPPVSDAAGAATYELLVDTSGSVQQVRLVSGDSGMRESMMRAHVKSWKFRPATRGGRPVQYRMQVRVPV